MTKTKKIKLTVGCRVIIKRGILSNEMSGTIANVNVSKNGVIRIKK